MIPRSVYKVFNGCIKHHLRVCSTQWTYLERKISTDSFDPRLRSYLMETKQDSIDKSSIKFESSSKDIPHHKIEKIVKLADQLLQCDEEFRELESITTGKIFYS